MSTKKHSSADDTGEVESPFLDEELFVGEAEEEWESRAAALAAESPYLHFNPEAFEEEVIGKDERILVTDTLKLPNRWICAIDILIDNPKWGTLGEPQFISKSRATGILIGPRYVLTARHILNKQTIEVEGEKKSVDVKRLMVSPARNGNNDKNPFGKIKSKAVQVSQPYMIRRKVKQGTKVIEIPIQQHDDYALIILEKDLASSTHSKMKGVLGYWGHDPTVAVIRRLEPKNIESQTIVVIGYAGDTCGKDKFSGSKSKKEQKIAYCWNRRNDEWASTQWRSVGTLQVKANSTTVFHSADTYEGQSGAPICLTADQKLHLVGIHTGSENSQRNKGVRVTRRMLKELCAWVNADAGYTMATIQDDTLMVHPKNSAEAKEFFDDLAEGESQLEGLTEGSPDELSLDTEQEWEDSELEGRDISDEAFLEERFDPSAVPKDVADALSKKDWPLALRLAIQAGWRDENELTNLIFFAQHPELPPEQLDPKGQNFKQLSGEWSRILDHEIWKAIAASAENTNLVVSGKEVTDHHWRFFRGKNGRRLKKLVEDAAREVDLNPGLLGTIMMTETRCPLCYLSSEKVSSYHIGTDDFYEGRTAIKARIPAYAKVKWDKSQKPSEHLNDAKKPRMVKTILFDSGSDAVLATAVYVKFGEARLREIAAELKGDFDSLPLATRFALTRMAMTAGAMGATPSLKDALQGKDIFIRKAIPVRAHQTKRNATVRTAQAMHLSDWVFGIPVPPAAASQPEIAESEDWSEEREGYYDLDPSLEREMGEDSGDLEFEDVWAEEEMDNYESALEYSGILEFPAGATEQELEVGEDREAGWDEEPVIIQRDVQDMPTREVAVGQRIELDLNDIEFARESDDIRWAIPGIVVRGYDGTVRSAKLFKLTGADLEQPKISFFWVDAADGRIVRARFRLKSGGLGQVVFVFDVKGPKVNYFTGKTDVTRIEKRAGLTGMRFGKLMEAPGIKWKWKITMPPNHAGFIKDVQTVLNNRSQILSLRPGGKETRKLVWRHPSKTNPHVQLDGHSDNQAAYTAGLYEPRIGAGESFTNEGTSDSPHTALPSLAKTVSVNDQFTYYLMFKPAMDKAQDAIWVPVAKAKWFWKATAMQRDKKWVLSQPKKKMEPRVEMATVDFPMYETNAFENEWQQIST